MNTFVLSCYTKETFKIVVNTETLENAKGWAEVCMLDDDYNVDNIERGLTLHRKDITRDFEIIDATEKKE